MYNGKMQANIYCNNNFSFLKYSNVVLYNLTFFGELFLSNFT